ncbi:Glu-tRNA(Gln) amidotransferase subunit GatE [Candidatus Woesearchaeota archaeon]|nr:Glu-tRNA(Gln) amidotransferase subunit GatE [Candidatus Woesearchaeota archaeon]
MDYKSINFKCGIECHQQLETHKLFCKCQSIVNDASKPDIFFERKLHISAGELGTKDIAALHEIKKGKTFFYEACSISSCLLELDQEPPREVNQDALKASLEISLLLNAKIIPNIQFMRKVVLDGSNVSGFQRTALVATDGYIETSKGKVGIDVICLEEEAAKKINEDSNSTTYRLDRLGIPLVEIATGSSIKDPDHAKEVAGIIGMILRSTGKVKRGIGSIRQDINLSIQNKPRIELKGFQDLRSIPKVIENEISRILSLKEYQSEVRRVNQDLTTTFLRPMPGSSRMYPETDHKTITITKEMLNKIKIPELLTHKAMKLEKEFKINPDLALGMVEDEDYFRLLADRFKNIQPSIIIHSIVELPKEAKSRFNYSASNDEIESILELLNENKITKDAMIKILEDKSLGKELSIKNYRPVDDSTIKEEIKNIMASNKHLSPNALMGIIMSKYKGKIDGKKTMEYIKKFIPV